MFPEVPPYCAHFPKLRTVQGWAGASVWLQEAAQAVNHSRTCAMCQLSVVAHSPQQDVDYSNNLYCSAHFIGMHQLHILFESPFHCRQ